MFVCGGCGYETPKWMGKCPECGAWNSFEERAAAAGSKSAKRASSIIRGGAPRGDAARVTGIAESFENASSVSRISTHSQELDRALGGGLVPKSVVLVSGEPGIGKSTLLLQAAASLQKRGPVLYVCAEESAEQVALRAKRLNLVPELFSASKKISGSSERADGGILLTSQYYVEDLSETVRKYKPVCVVVDSIQTLKSRTLGDTSGRLAHVSACAAECCEWAREYESAVFLIAHVTKDGGIAGPKLIEHMVDTVLMFESSKSSVRFLYAQKNRYGATDEVGIFSMTAGGLADVANAGSFFLEEREGAVPPGICVAATHEGSRPFLVEIQALTISCAPAQNRVYSERIDSRQIFRIAAVLERHAGVPLSGHNMYVNVAGGIRIQEPGAELALLASLYCAYKQRAVSKHVCAVGEVSLAGEIRPVEHFAQRCRQAFDCGFSDLIAPRGNVKASSELSKLGDGKNQRVHGVSTVGEAIALLEKL